MENVDRNLLGKYQLLAQIGHGGMAEVYKAYHPGLHRYVAVKVLRASMEGSRDLVARFEREAAAVARMRHPHIVQIYDFVLCDGQYYLVMEFVDGPTLEQELQRRSSRKQLFTLSEMSSIFGQLSSAVEYAHRQGIIHRDLKPSNVMLRSDGQVVLTDFGIARFVDVTNYTQSGAVIGTFQYMSPEQCEGRPADARSDIYALGIILYEMMTGRTPFVADQAVGQLYKHIHERPSPPSSLNPHIPRDVEQIVLKSLSKSPQDRYQTVEEMARALQDAIAGQETGLAPVLPPAEIGIAREPLGGPSTALLQFDSSSVPGKVSVVVYDEPGVFERPAQLFGRDDLVNEVQPLLDMRHQVLLHGLGGCGKTALAATLADISLHQGTRSVIWVQTGHEEADAIFDALADQLADSQEKREIALATGNHKLKRVRDMLGRCPASLLVLDDVWHEDALQVLKAIPRDMAVIVTSRRRFALPHIIDVGDLSPDAALDLLSYHAELGSLQRDPGARQLCESLGWHAYALEIAGNILKVDDRTPRQLLNLVGDAPHDMTMPEGGATAGRESVGALLDSSYSFLPEPERTAFLAIGELFASGATSTLLSQYVTVKGVDVGQALNALVRRGLAKRRVYQDGEIEYYYVHDLTFHYARAKARSEIGGDDEARIAIVQQYVIEHAHDFDRLELDMANILGAVQTAGRANPENLVQVMSWLCVGGYPRPQGPSYLDVRGHTVPLLRRLDAAIEAAGQMSRDEVLHYLWGKRGNAYHDRGDLAKCRDAYEAALRFAPTVHRRIVLSALVGKVSGELGHAQEAADLLQGAHDLARETGNDDALSYVLEVQSFWAAQQKDFEATRRFAAESVGIARRQGNKRRVGFSLLNLGSAERDLGHPDKALAVHQEALGIAREEGLPVLEAYVLQAMGEDYYRLGQLDDAVLRFNKAIAMHTETGGTDNVTYIQRFCQEKAIRLKEE